MFRKWSLFILLWLFLSLSAQEIVAQLPNSSPPFYEFIANRGQ